MTCTPTAHTACASAFRAAYRHAAEAQALAAAPREPGTPVVDGQRPGWGAGRRVLACSVAALTLLASLAVALDSAFDPPAAGAVAMSAAPRG